MLQESSCNSLHAPKDAHTMTLVIIFLVATCVFRPVSAWGYKAINTGRLAGWPGAIVLLSALALFWVTVIALAITKRPEIASGLIGCATALFTFRIWPLRE